MSSGRTDEDGGEHRDGARATATIIENRPQQPALSYRIGTHPAFKQAMLQELSRHPALSRLSARQDDDPAIALLDGWASVLDVLSFYQERIANEGFLRTATERRSLLELARSIGYELGPGVAASTWLAIILEDAPGSNRVAQLDPGLRVQSVPGQNEMPQTFETVEHLEARVEHNRLPPRRYRPQVINQFSTRLCLRGVTTRLQPGDRLLIVGSERDRAPSSERWDVRTLLTVTPIPEQNLTWVTWREALGQPKVQPAAHPRVFAFRKRAALFGHNAPDWRVVKTTCAALGDDAGTEWRDFRITTASASQIDLDAVYPDILAGSWVLLSRPTYDELYRVTATTAVGRTDFTLATKVSRLTLDAATHLADFGLRDTTVHMVTEELQLADDQLSAPVFGERVELGCSVPALAAGRTVIVSGIPVTRVEVAPRRRIRRVAHAEKVEIDAALSFVSNPGGARVLEDGEQLEVVASPVRLPDGRLRWSLREAQQGRTGTVDTDEDDLVPVSGEACAPAFLPDTEPDRVSEAITVRRVEARDDGLEDLVFAAPLARVYHRASVHILANVVRATHGESRTEVLGSGDHGTPMQRFTLHQSNRQSPLTFVSAPVAQGGLSTLEIKVAGVAWREVESFYGQPPDATVFATRRSEDGSVTVMFGDGVNGARLPTGRDNVTASYRVGTGRNGQVRPGQLSLLLKQPLGVKAATNPLPAIGAQDPEALDEARANAPLTVMTLDRIVSVGDFEDFARAFAGIGKAQAMMLWNGERRVVHITVAAAGGGPVPDGSELQRNLRLAIARAGHTDHEVRIDSYRERLFSLDARILVNEGHSAPAVLGAVRAALLERYSFAARSFAAPVSAADIAAVIHSVTGVLASVLDLLNGRDPIAEPLLDASPAHWDEARTTIVPAQLLMVAPSGIRLQEMLA